MAIISEPRGLFPSYFSWISASLRASCKHTWKQELHWGCFLRVLIWTTKRLWICAPYCVVCLCCDKRLSSLHFTVPPPTSPTTKSAGTPSEAESQDSDGAVGPRCARTHAHAHLLTYLSLVSQIGEQLKKVNISIGWYQGDSVQFALNAYMKTLTDPYSICCLKSITYAI